MLTHGVPRGAPGVPDFNDIAGKKREALCFVLYFETLEISNNENKMDHSDSLAYSLGIEYHYIFYCCFYLDHKVEMYGSFSAALFFVSKPEINTTTIHINPDINKNQKEYGN